MTDPDLLSAAEAAELLGCSKRTIHRRILRGELPAARQMPGETGAFLLRRSDVERARQYQLGRDRRYTLAV